MNTIEQFMKSDTAKKISREADRETLAERKRMVKEIDRLQAAGLERVSSFDKKIEGAKEKFKELEKELEQARIEWQKAVLEKSSYFTSMGGQISGLEGKLKADASPLIDAFQREIWTAHESERHHGDHERTKELLKAICEVWSKAEAMKLEAVSDVGADLQKLYDLIPGFSGSIPSEDYSPASYSGRP